MTDLGYGYCPRCGSNKPNLHPCSSEGGEVFPCPNDFHRQVTPENTEQRVKEMDAYFAKVGAK